METNFQDLMKQLFRHMRIELPQKSENEVYSVQIDGKLTMKFFAAPAEYLNMISVIGKLPDAAGPGFLLNILHLNCFTPIYPHFNFKVGVDQTTRNVELWMREPLNGLEPGKLIELFQFVVETAAYVQSWMERPLTKERARQQTERFLSNSHRAP